MTRILVVDDEPDLESLIKQDPTFLEAQARFAKLCCLQGKWDASIHWSQRVLDSKPWHFVTLETMVAANIAKGDLTMVELYKARRLPVPSKTEERSQWVDRALQDAQVILKRMEKLS